MFDEVEWFKHRQSKSRVQQLSVYGLLRNWYIVPSFQRESVWTPEMQVDYCNNIFLGYPTATIFVWERFVGNALQSVIIDGQQRLTALGVQPFRVDRTRNPPSQAYFDPKLGLFTTDPGDWALTPDKVCPANTVAYRKYYRELEKAGDPRLKLWDAITYASDILGSRMLTVFTFRENADQQFVLDAFRSINRPGVVCDPNELKELIRSASELRY